MNPSRRRTLAMIGGGAIVAAAGAGGLALTRSAEAALAPWRVAGDYPDLRMRALSWAILAPNPHNRQPWQADLSVPGEVGLYVDTTRMLPHTDPYNRQITIGLGCFLEILRMAAAEEGVAVDFDLFPQGADTAALDSRPVAIARFGGRSAPDPLFAQVANRRSLKEPYDLSRPVADRALEAIEAVVQQCDVGSTNERSDVAQLRTLSHDALQIEIDTPRTYKESVELFRIGRQEIEANPDGIDFGGPMFEALALAGLMTRAKALDTESTVYKQGAAAVLANTDTAMAHVWLVTPGNSREDQIRAGQDWVRVNLAATEQSIGVQPLSQALQEYPELAAIYTRIHDLLAPGGGTVQMFARLGHGPAVAPSPRWPLKAKLIA